MKRVTVKASGQYDVLIGTGLLELAGEQICNIRKVSKVAIISDSHVWPLYGSTLSASLSAVGIESISFVFAAGESSKNMTTYLQILDFLAENHITRSDMILALGGGVVGDIAGFAAATFLRGISYIQLPTSLLAMVDSSVGGKTAVDLPAGKNLVGAFKQPELVLCDISALSTLPQEQFIDGCAEIIKYAMLYDAELFNELNRDGVNFDHENVITRCIALKRDVVQQDEFDTGERQKLNFGHTFGHSIEAASNFTITHGHAVATGMAIITKAAVSYGYCNVEINDRLTSLLEKFTLPVTTCFGASELLSNALSDKKRAGDTLNLIVPREIGRCESLPTPIHQLESFIKAGL